MTCMIPISIGTVPLVSNLRLPVDDELSYLDIPSAPPASMNMGLML